MELYLSSQFDVQSNMPHAILVSRLKENVGNPKFWQVFSKENRKTFLGEVNENNFTIKLNISYRNGSLPILSGELEPHSSGTNVFIKMEPREETYTYLKTWVIGFLALMFFSIAIHQFFTMSTLLVIFVFSIGIAICYYGFWSEVPRSKKEFLKIVGS